MSDFMLHVCAVVSNHETMIKWNFQGVAKKPTLLSVWASGADWKSYQSASQSMSN